MAVAEECVAHLQEHCTEDLKLNKGYSETPMFYVHSIARLFTNSYYYAVWDAKKVGFTCRLQLAKRRSSVPCKLMLQ